ncbi:MAG: hypothetical protein ACTHNS_13340 [Marmoricola sp.]
MSDLQTALHRLAEADAPSVPPHDLWRRGVRRHRIRAAAGAAGVLVVVLAIGVVALLGPGIGVRGGVRPAAPVPATGPHLPRSVGVPVPDAAGTAQAGPLGRLAVLWRAGRDGHPAGAFFGVSARTGAYRWLDLPRLAGPDDVRLSPDGRTIAYWATGRVLGTPITLVGGEAMGTVGALARYDTRTGRTRFQALPSPHGIAPGGIRWTDEHTVLFGWATIRSRHQTTGATTWSWRGRDAARPAPGAPSLDSWTPTPGGDHVVAVDDRFAVLPAGGIAARAAVPVRGLPSVAWSEVTTDGRHVVGIRIGPDPATITDAADLLSGPVRQGRVGRLRRVPDVVAADLVGWRAPGTVLLVEAPSRGGITGHLAEMDSRTGAVHRLGTVTDDDGWPGAPQYASSLAHRPLVEGSVPARPRGDGWWWWVAMGSLALVARAAIRRRRRGRG